MPFDLEKNIIKDYEQTLMNHLNVDTLENHDIKIELLRPENNQLFSICYQLSYMLTLLEENLLAITATSESFCNQSLSLFNRNHIRKLYDHNFIDRSTINNLRKTEPNREVKSYSFCIREKNKQTTLNILFVLQIIETSIKSTNFVKDYLIEYKLKKDIGAFYPKLKQFLLDNYKENNSLPNREDKKYKKIEEFQPYELTYKIFYEMAIRTDGASKILNALNCLRAVKSIHNNELRIDKIDCHIDIEEKIYTITGVLNLKNTTKANKIFTSINDGVIQCIEAVNDNKFEVKILVDRDSHSLDLHLEIRSETCQEDRKSLGSLLANCKIAIRSTTTGVSKKNKKIKTSVNIGSEKYSLNDNDECWQLELDNPKQVDEDFLQPEEYQIYSTIGLIFINDLMKELETELIEEYLIYPSNYSVRQPESSRILLKKALNNSVDIQAYQNDSTYKHENKYFFKEDEYDGYSVHQGILKDLENSYDVNTIKNDSTKRVVDNNMLNLQINLNLPKKELISYFEKIKENYDNDRSIFKSPNELKSAEIDAEFKDMQNFKSIAWADTFYIYDYYKTNKVENKTDIENGIKINLHYYHEDLADSTQEEPSTLDEKDYISVDTIKRRYQLMKSLINEQKYKFLLSRNNTK